MARERRGQSMTRWIRQKMDHSKDLFVPRMLDFQLDDVAAAYGISLEMALLLHSCMIAGIGGTDPLRFSCSTCPIILAAEAQSEARFLDRLSVDLRFAHRGLSEKRRYLRTRRPLEEFENKSTPGNLGYVAQAAKPGESPYDESLLHGESSDFFQTPIEELRLEAVLRPGFLVENLALGDLKSVLPRLHRLEGFYPGSAPTILPRDFGKRRAWADELCDFLDGKSLPGVENLDPEGANEPLVARLQMVMRLGHEGRKWAITEHSGLQSKCLILPATSTRSVARDSAPDGKRLESYWGNFHEACRRALARRRAGLPPFDGKTDGEQLELKFINLYRSYSQFIGSDAILNSCTPLARLPEFLAAGIQALAGRDSVVGIEECAFDAARRLAEAHRSEILSHLHSERLEDFRAIAARVVAVVKRKQPLSLRALTRSFDQQRVAIYSPVVDLLLTHNVLNGDAGGLCLGPRQLVELDLCIGDVLHLTD